MNARTLFALLALGAVGCAAQSTESAAALAASVDSTARQTFLPVVLVPRSVEVIHMSTFDPKRHRNVGGEFLSADRYAELDPNRIAAIGVASHKGVKVTLLDYTTGDPLPAISDTVRYVHLAEVGVDKSHHAVTLREDCPPGMFCLLLNVEPEK